MLNKATKETKVLDYDNEQTKEINILSKELELKEYNLSVAYDWNTSTIWGLPKATKIGRVVYIGGFVTGGGPNSVMVSNMPQLLRPSKPMRFKTASAGTETLVQVNDNGTITCLGTNTTNIFLDGICYIV